jgi:hypothetical protein
MVETGNSTVQLIPSGVASPAHMAMLLGSDARRIEQSARTIQIGGFSINQPIETVQGSLPKTISANLVATNTTTAATPVDGRPGDRIPTVFNSVTAGDQEKLLSPHAAGLVVDATPFERLSLERVIDEFFNELEELGVGQLVEQGPTQVIPLSLALIGTATAVELARRRLQSTTGIEKLTRRQDPLGSEELLGFPELPGSWSTRLT